MMKMMKMALNMMKLMMITHSGPGFWVVSQALLLLYFYLDNGSNVCGLEFNYSIKKRKKKEEEKEEDKKEEKEKDEDKKKKEEKKEEKEELEKEGQEKEEDEEKNVEKEKEKEEDKKLEEVEDIYNGQIFRQLFRLRFEVASEEGR